MTIPEIDVDLLRQAVFVKDLKEHHRLVSKLPQGFLETLARYACVPYAIHPALVKSDQFGVMRYIPTTPAIAEDFEAALHLYERRAAYNSVDWDTTEEALIRARRAALRVWDMPLTYACVVALTLRDGMLDSGARHGRIILRAICANLLAHRFAGTRGPGVKEAFLGIVAELQVLRAALNQEVT